MIWGWSEQKMNFHRNNRSWFFKISDLLDTDYSKNQLWMNWVKKKMLLWISTDSYNRRNEINSWIHCIDEEDRRSIIGIFKLKVYNKRSRKLLRPNTIYGNVIVETVTRNSPPESFEESAFPEIERRVTLKRPLNNSFIPPLIDTLRSTKPNPNRSSDSTLLSLTPRFVSSSPLLWTFPIL